jgi:hypothetical protein
MLSDESLPIVRVLSDDVSLATREKRLVSRKRLENLAPISSRSRSALWETFQFRDKSYHQLSDYFRRTANPTAKSETYMVGDDLSRACQRVMTRSKRRLVGDGRLVQNKFFGKD